MYVYMYMQILVAMGIQWGHGLSECSCSILGLVVSDKLESIIILRCSMTLGQGIIL